MSRRRRSKRSAFKKAVKKIIRAEKRKAAKKKMRAVVRGGSMMS